MPPPTTLQFFGAKVTHNAFIAGIFVYIIDP